MKVAKAILFIVLSFVPWKNVIDLPVPIIPPPIVVNPVEAKCLAMNIYYEGRGEPYAGRVAIAMATLNRLKHAFFPKTVCAVVYQPGQFSWTTEAHEHMNSWSWHLALRLANKVLARKIPDNTNGATYFHVKSITPNWPLLQQTVVIGHHIFYRRKEPVADVSISRYSAYTYAVTIKGEQNGRNEYPKWTIRKNRI